MTEDEDAAEDVTDDDNSDDESDDSDEAASDDSDDDDSGDDDILPDEDSDEIDQPNLDPFADKEEEDLSFLMEGGDEGYPDLDIDEDEAAEGKSGGGFRISFLLLAYLVALLFFGGVIGWLLMAGEEKSTEAETTVATFTSSLPPEMEAPWQWPRPIP